MKFLRRVLILSHRYLGIAVCLLAVMWFATGFVMMYAGGMPRLTPESRLERLPALDLSRVTLTPVQAAERIGALDGPGRTSLVSVMGRPAYRVGGGTVFADTGEVLDEISSADARTVAASFLGVRESQVEHVARITRSDQWTLDQSRQLPLHKFRVADDSATEVYVDPDRAEVVQLTTRKSRTLAWIGTIPHWLYFSALRNHQVLWYRIVVWTSAIVCVVAILGLALGITQFRRRKPFSFSAAIPYSGWTRWHYITGAVFGVFTVTWAFSGMLSMEPFAWTNARGVEVRRDVFTGGELDLAPFNRLDPEAWRGLIGERSLKELEFVRMQDEHFYVARSVDTPPNLARERLHQPYYITGRAESGRMLVAASTFEPRREPFSPESLVERLRAELPDTPIAGYEVLTEYDSYYYSRYRLTPLPVLRVRFEDPAETWMYIDPAMSAVLSEVPRLARLERWLYNGLHSLDFAFWYNRRPLWDAGMIVLLLGGLVSSVLGLMLGVRRLRRSASRAVNKSWSDVPATSTARLEG